MDIFLDFVRKFKDSITRFHKVFYIFIINFNHKTAPQDLIRTIS